MIDISAEPLGPHLVELVSRPEAKGTILAGGLGLRIKRAHLAAEGVRTLIPELPEIRATTDIDLFLQMEIWTEPDAAADFKRMLEELGYEAVQAQWKFEKTLTDGGSLKSKLDLMARRPRENESVRVNPPRVGQGIHGRLTEEAFAIGDSPILVQVGANARVSEVLIAHPYAFLNLKLAAANDWLVRKPGSSEKHVADVYRVVAMMTETEYERAQELSRSYKDDSTALRVREAARILFEGPESMGAQRIRNELGDETREHFLVFRDALFEALGV